MPARPLTTLLLASAVALGITATADAATVTRIVDGDTIKVRDGKRSRTVDLLGVEAPACHAAAAKQALQRLLPRKATVRLQRDGANKGRYVHRGATHVNVALLRQGAVKATAGVATLRLGSTLSAAEQQARAAKRGLWATCPEPAPGQPPASPDDPVQRARKDLAGRVFIRITATTFSSTESHLHLCSDGRFVEDVSTYSQFGGGSESPLPDSDATHQRYGGGWEVVAAEYRPEGAGARVRRLNDDGTETFVDFVATGAGVTVNGAPVSTQTSGICT
jgi:endonuclease YncB( thermonuclease family)